MCHTDSSWRGLPANTQARPSTSESLTEFTLLPFLPVSLCSPVHRLDTRQLFLFVSKCYFRWKVSFVHSLHSFIHSFRLVVGHGASVPWPPVSIWSTYLGVILLASLPTPCWGRERVERLVSLREGTERAWPHCFPSLSSNPACLHWAG